MPPWRWKHQGTQRQAKLPYANGLPKYYRFRLAARIILVCAAATASTSAVIIAYSFFSPVLMLVPWVYVTSELAFAAISWRRWHCFSNMKHEAGRESLRVATVAASKTDTSTAAAAAASVRFEAVASALARGGPAEVESFLGLWFHGTPIAEIGRGNLKDLLAYAFFFAEDSSIAIAQGHEALLDSMVDRLETLLCPTDLTDACPPRAGTAGVNSSDPVQHPYLHPEIQHKRELGAGLAPGSVEDASTASVSGSFAAAGVAVPAEALRGRTLSPGTIPGLRFMAHMTEPIPHFYRPLAFYVVMEAMFWINHCMLVAAGFRRMELPPPRATTSRSKPDWGEPGGDGGAQERDEDVHPSDHCYYIANMPTADSDSGRGGSNMVPIVFLHGVGMGLMPYLRFLVALAATGAPIIAFELKHVSQRWTRGHPPSMRKLAEDVVLALQRHGFSQAALLAHSFGTAVASVLMQTHPGVVRHVVMLDPICFNMYMPRLLRNFIYRRIGAAAASAAVHADMAATTANATTSGGASQLQQLPPPRVPGPDSGSAGSSSGLLGIVTAMLRGIAGVTLDLLMLGPARELHCTSLLCRRVVWSEINLWEHMVPEHCTVVLSGRDDLSCPRSLERWLREHTSATVIVHPELMHAQICVAWSRQDELLHRMLQVVYGNHGGGSTDSRPEARNAAPMVTSAMEKDFCADSSNLEACSKLHSKEVRRGSRGEHWRRLSPGNVGIESVGGCRNTGSWMNGNFRNMDAVAEDGADSDTELLSLTRWCGSSPGRRRGGSLDSPSGKWGGGGRPWRQRFCRDTSRQHLSASESSEEEGAFTGALQRPLRRLSVERHDSAGSYMRLPSSGTLQSGGIEAEVGTA